jgi:hypothetical protein
MGMFQDMTQRKSSARVDDEKRRNHVKAARIHIYDKNKGTNSKVVEDLLQPTSLVPTAVCISFLLHVIVIMMIIQY